MPFCVRCIELAVTQHVISKGQTGSTALKIQNAHEQDSK